MNAAPLTPELYEELKRGNYKYLVFKRSAELPNADVYEPVKELPNHFVISLSSIEDDAIKSFVGQQKILIDY